MNRRDFLTRCWQTILGFIVVVFNPKTAIEKPKVADGELSILLEDNRTYSKLPDSGPQHVIDQILTDGLTGNKYKCVKIEDTASHWVKSTGFKKVSDYPRRYRMVI